MKTNGKNYNMEQQLKTKWIQSLRSGEYKQAHNRLKGETREGIIGYCCLGVLCEVNGDKINDSGSGIESREGSSYDYLGKLISRDESRAMELTDHLINLNDKEKVSFLEIANYIEENI